MVDDLAAFYRARLDEDETLAAAAWLPTDKGVWIHNEDAWRDVGAPDAAIAAEAHISHQSPARTFREVETKRAILAELEALPHYCAEDHWYSCPLAVDPEDLDHEPGSGFNEEAWDPREPLRCTCGRDEHVRRTLSWLAAVYSGHPGYRPEWKPS